jgi:hypothetical protein
MSGQRWKRLWDEITDRALIPDNQGWARAVCAVCVTTLATVEAAAVTLRSRSSAQEMLAASDSWSARLEELQYTLGEGPGVEAFTRGGAVLVSDVSADQSRWPVFAAAALEAGASAVFAFPLQVSGILFGTLNLYRRRGGGLATGELSDAALLADLATKALLKSAARIDWAGIEWTRPAGSYQNMNIATGMVAARLRISLDDAFARLRGYAFAANRSVLDVARDIVQRRIAPDEFPRR